MNRLPELRFNGKHTCEPGHESLSSLAGASGESEFARLHGLASVAYLITGVLGLALVTAPAKAPG